MRSTILVADADRSVREALRNLLLAEGYGVILALDSQSAVDRVLAGFKPVDLILLDPSISLQKRTPATDRLGELNRKLPVILLTGRPHQCELAERCQVSALIEKPIDVPALLSLIRELLAEVNTHRSDPPGRSERAFQHLPAYRVLPEPPTIRSPTLLSGSED